MRSKKSVLPAHTVSAVNAYLVIGISLWAYTDTGSKGIVLPVLFAVLILIMNSGLQYGSKGPTRVVLLMTLVIIAIEIIDLRKFMYYLDNMGILRSGLILASSLFSSIVLVVSMGKSKLSKKKT